jgi:adenosyl cobinamide kinase/adenosyl cobinamide phosphate guanylyltransferase
MMRGWIRMGMCLAGMLGAVGCAGYRLGSSLPPDINVVYVPTFVNRTTEPRLETEVTHAVVSEFQRDGTLAVSSEDKADVVLSVALTDFTMNSLRYERDQAKTTEEYRLYLTAQVTLTKRATGTVLLATVVTGETEVVPTGDLGSAKRAVLPALADDLAHRIVEAVVEFW